MILEKIKIKNFRCYHDETEIPISDLTAFIGRNDSGKSTILDALEIFFNNSVVTCEKEDLNIFSSDNNIEITCIFSDLPEELIIDTDNPTKLEDEYLLNHDGMLEIKKVFPATSSKPKEKIFIICNHPTVDNSNDLLTLKRQQLRTRAKELEIDSNQYNANVNSSIRKAIWDNFEDLQLEITELLVDKEDTKKVYSSLENYLPIYALFQSDRQSTDGDKEVADPMKIAVQQALSELNTEIELIKSEVRDKAIATANRTLEKLKDMSPDLASELIPEFKSEPKFDSQFKLTIKSDNDIPINKRGSGVRRLVLLNFFRAEAERLRVENPEKKIIYGFEEPETSQHPDHQKILIKTFIEISNSGNSQVILTTHTPALGGLLPLESLRLIEIFGNDRIVEVGNDDIYEKIADTLGVLPDPFSKSAKAILLLEGKSDITFVKHTAEQLKTAGHLPHTLTEKGIALVPIGGCGNLKHWRTLRLVEQFNIPYCVLIDSDKGTSEETINLTKISELHSHGIKAYLTRKRELENYIHLDCLTLPRGSTFRISDTCDAKNLIAREKGTRSTTVIEDYWTLMNAVQIREVEKYFDNGNPRYEFTEMFIDFLDLVN